MNALLRQATLAAASRSMMIRGESFRSDFRVPTHMVHCMTNAQSIDRLVQSTGRATFLGKDFLARNGFNCVQARGDACRRGE